VAEAISDRGQLIIIGGHEDRDGDRMILEEVARSVGDGSLVIATVASSSPQEYFDIYHRVFTELGVKDICELYVHDREESANEEKLACLKDAAGIFFSGGDQLRIASQIGDTPFENHVRRIFAEGGTVAGTSAGASAMGELMLVRGSNAESHRLGDIHLAAGLNLVTDVIIDQHFAERGRIGRLLGAVALNPRILGIGIDEDTAIIARDGRFRVMGSGAVYIIDGAGMTRSNIADGANDTTLSMFNVKLHVMSHGDHFNLHARRPEHLEIETQ
jgi:cyanophycinase